MADIILPVRLREEAARRAAARLQRSIDDLRQSVDQLQPAFRRATSGTQAFGRAAARDLARAERHAEGLRSSLGRLRTLSTGTFAGFGLGLAVRQFTQMADAGARVETLFRQITDNAQELASRQGEIYQLAQDLRSPVEAVARVYARTTLALGEAYNPDRIRRFTQSIFQLGIASGATSEELSNATRQLLQGLGSARLQGDELRSVLENLPAVARELARELGVPYGQLRELGASGRLVPRAIFEGLERAAPRAQAQFEDVGLTFQQVFDRFGNTLREEFNKLSETGSVMQGLDKTLQETVAPGVVGLTNAILQLLQSPLLSGTGILGALLLGQGVGALSSRRANLLSSDRSVDVYLNRFTSALRRPSYSTRGGLTYVPLDAAQEQTIRKAVVDAIKSGETRRQALLRVRAAIPRLQIPDEVFTDELYGGLRTVVNYRDRVRPSRWRARILSGLGTATGALGSLFAPWARFAPGNASPGYPGRWLFGQPELTTRPLQPLPAGGAGAGLRGLAPGSAAATLALLGVPVGHWLYDEVQRGRALSTGPLAGGQFTGQVSGRFAGPTTVNPYQEFFDGLFGAGAWNNIFGSGPSGRPISNRAGLQSRHRAASLLLGRQFDPSILSASDRDLETAVKELEREINKLTQVLGIEGNPLDELITILSQEDLRGRGRVGARGLRSTGTGPRVLAEGPGPIPPTYDLFTFTTAAGDTTATTFVESFRQSIVEALRSGRSEQVREIGQAWFGTEMESYVDAELNRLTSHIDRWRAGLERGTVTPIGNAPFLNAPTDIAARIAFNEARRREPEGMAHIRNVIALNEQRRGTSLPQRLEREARERREARELAEAIAAENRRLFRRMREEAERQAEIARNAWLSAFADIGGGLRSLLAEFQDNTQGWLRVAERLLRVVVSLQIARERSDPNFQGVSNATALFRGFLGFGVYHGGRVPASMTDTGEHLALLRNNETVLNPRQIANAIEGGGGRTVVLNQTFRTNENLDEVVMGVLRRRNVEASILLQQAA